MTLDGHIKTGLAYGTVGLTFFITGEVGVSTQTAILLFVAFVIGNVGPDLSEMGIIPHRTYTHFPWFYILIVIATSLGLEFTGYQQYEVGAFGTLGLTFGLGYALGCLFHIICDIPYGGIPYFKPWKKIALFFVKFDSVTNKIIEHAAIIIALLIILSSVLDVNDLVDVESTLDVNSFNLSSDRG
jgi:hypothetical protein